MRGVRAGDHIKSEALPQPFVESDPGLDDATLGRRADQDGYLFFRGLADKPSIREVRQDVTAILKTAGWLDPGSDPFLAQSTQPARLAGSPEFTPYYDMIQRLESFHTLAHMSPITTVLQRLLGEPPLSHPTKILRVLFPDKLEHTTAAHQDFVLIQGTPEVWTAWFPLGDCPRELGGLAVLPGSHKQGLLPVHRALGAGNIGVETGRDVTEWAFSPFQTGDVLFFHSHTVHRGLENRSANRIRLSVDFRYQRPGEPIAEKFLLPHQGRLSWEEIYVGWHSDRYQYYWKRHRLTTVPLDLDLKTPVEERAGSSA